MAVTNTEAITFSNESIRKVADLIAQLYYAGKTMNDEWTARGLSAVIPDDSAEKVHDSAYGTDGTDGDGRPVVDGACLNSVVQINVDIITGILEANSNAKLNKILNVAVNTRG